MELYWVSLLIQETENSRPWLSAMLSGCMSLEKAIDIVEKSRNDYRVLCAWIDKFDENGNKSVVFHECYVNSIGTVNRIIVNKL